MTFFGRRLIKIITFLTVGASTALLKFLLFSLFYKLFSLHYQSAVSLAYVLGVLFHFTANRQFSFQSREKNIHHQVSKYALLTVTNYLITLLVMHVFVESLHLSPYVGFAASLLLTATMGYSVMRFWVFAKSEGKNK